MEKGAHGKTTPRERRIIIGEPSDSALAWLRARVRWQLALARGGAASAFFSFETRSGCRVHEQARPRVKRGRAANGRTEKVVHRQLAQRWRW